MPDAEAKNRLPNLVVASLGAQKKEKPGGVISARLLFDHTNGDFASTSTFGLTADVKEAHRQVPIHPDDWHLLGCHLERGGEVFVDTVGTFGVFSAGSEQQWEDSHSTSPPGMPQRGSCYLRTTTLSQLVVLISGLLSWYSSCCVKLLCAHSRGTRRTAEQ